MNYDKWQYCCVESSAVVEEFLLFAVLQPGKWSKVGLYITKSPENTKNGLRCLENCLVPNITAVIKNHLHTDD